MIRKMMPPLLLMFGFYTLSGCSSNPDYLNNNYSPLAAKDRPDKLLIRPRGSSITISEGVTLELSAIGYRYYSNDYYYKPVEALWSLESGVGSISQTGQYYSRKYGTAEITASYEGLSVARTIIVMKLSSSPAVLIFSDNAEAGINSWEAAGFSVALYNSHGGAYSFRSGGDDGAENTLKLKTPLSITGTEVLKFWNFCFQYNDKSALFVEASEDGKNWVSVWSNVGNHDWVDEKIGLVAFIGKTIYLRFRYLPKESSGYKGLYIDDISIER